QVMLGNGAGQFDVLGPMNIPPAAALAVFDMDGDGLVDIVSASSPPNALFVSRNSGGGMFQTIEGTSAPAFTHLAAGFLDGDSVADVIGCDGSGVVSIAHGTVPGLIASPSSVARLPAPANALALIDVNGDGATDALFATPAGLLMLDGAGSVLRIVLP